MTEEKDLEEKEEEEKPSDDDKALEKKDESEEEGGEEKKDEEAEGEEKKEEFEKEKESVPTNQHNQALRKLREAELEKRELEQKVKELQTQTPPVEKKVVKEEKKEEEGDDEDFWGTKDEKKGGETKDEIQRMIDSGVAEKLKPIYDAQEKTTKESQKKDREAFFVTNPQYLTNAEAWQELLDEMERSINPNSGDPYITQLKKAHLILVGSAEGDSDIEDKKKEIANQASSAGDGGGAAKGADTEGFSTEETKIMKEMNISKEGMKSFKEKVKSGSMQLFIPSQS